MKNKKNLLLIIAVISLTVFCVLIAQKVATNHKLEVKSSLYSAVEKPLQKGDSLKTREDKNYKVVKYGYSGNSVPLIAHKFSNKSPNKKILCVFAIHGFEDAFYKDGQALVDTANGVIDYFKKNASNLNSSELIIISCANPDGLAQGWTCNGPGRCQISKGIDINMDTDYNFKVRNNPRNKTAQKAFSSPESAALRDLVLNEKPDIVIDFHGWINCAAGDQDIANIFCNSLGVEYQEKNKAIFDGFFIGWAGKYARAVLVEYPNPYTGKGSFDGKSDKKYDYVKGGFNDFGYAEKTAKAIEEIVKRDLN